MTQVSFPRHNNIVTESSAWRDVSWGDCGRLAVTARMWRAAVDCSRHGPQQPEKFGLWRLITAYEVIIMIIIIIKSPLNYNQLRCKSVCPDVCKTLSLTGLKHPQTVPIFICTLASNGHACWCHLPLYSVGLRPTCISNDVLALKFTGLELNLETYGLGIKDFWHWPWPGTPLALALASKTSGLGLDNAVLEHIPEWQYIHPPSSVNWSHTVQISVWFYVSHRSFSLL